MIVGSFRDKLCVCDWAEGKRRSTNEKRICRFLNTRYEELDSILVRNAIAQLDDYFSGNLKSFSLPIRFTGSQFQNKVWLALMSIPYGQTISYHELAQRIEQPKAVRAVVSAIASNPISLIVPCHRIIGKNNTLTGYAGGIEAKQYILSLEIQAHKYHK
ncbi:MAG: methylated-DNA--[protein]-cysteine S-methyltransferase [Muribaculum sp.]|nr:methylated-DNA--[protein]-cysteine S-methyltransferase [Muribaculum sp.]